VFNRILPFISSEEFYCIKGEMRPFSFLGGGIKYSPLCLYGGKGGWMCRQREEERAWETGGDVGRGMWEREGLGRKGEGRRWHLEERNVKFRLWLSN
jgi:hypothetical protein